MFFYVSVHLAKVCNIFQTHLKMITLEKHITLWYWEVTLLKGKNCQREMGNVFCWNKISSLLISLISLKSNLSSRSQKLYIIPLLFSTFIPIGHSHLNGKMRQSGLWSCFGGTLTWEGLGQKALGVGENYLSSYSSPHAHLLFCALN